MRVPWLSFSAVATLAALAVVNLHARTLPPDTAPTKLQTHAIQPQPPRAATSVSTLIIPVAGVSRANLTDTWGQARSEGRVHEGIDILAPMGTQVFAAADGRIVKFFDSVRGGVTIYQFDASERFIYYYAHLSARAPGLAEGMAVRQGQVIGFVGMTGNAPVTHLHFEVERLGPEKHWWQAEAMNPYPLLMAGAAPQA